MIDAALEKIGVGRAVFVVHSWSGALGARMALDHPARVAGLVMLAPVAYPWPGGVGWYNTLVTWPLIGPLLARTVTLPLGTVLAGPGARAVFQPQIMPEDYLANTATLLVLRPREFLANAWDLVTLKAAVSEQAPRYGEIKVPTVVISGEIDKTVSTKSTFAAVRGRRAGRQTDRAARCRSHGAERRARSGDLRDRGHDRRARAARRGRGRPGGPDRTQLQVRPGHRIGTATAG